MSEREIPYFQICECKQHGRIVYSESKYGGEIYDKNSTDSIIHYTHLISAFTNKNFFPGELADRIYNDIYASELPQVSDSDHTIKVVNTWNTAKLAFPNLDPADFHKISEKLWHYRVND